MDPCLIIAKISGTTLFWIIFIAVAVIGAYASHLVDKEKIQREQKLHQFLDQQLNRQQLATSDRPKSIEMDVDDLKNKIRSGEIKVVIRNPDNSQKIPTEMDLDEIIEKIRSGEIKATLRKD